MIKYPILLNLLCCILPCTSLFAYPQNSEKTIILNHADSLIGLKIDGEEARQLIGKVKFTHGKTIVTCNRAIQYLKSNKVTLEGEVEVYDDSVRMVSDRGIYYGDKRMLEAFERVWLEENFTTLKSKYGQYYVDEKKAFFKTNVIAEDTASTLICDELTYFREEQKSVAVGNVKIVNNTNNISIFGNRFENFRKQNYSRMTENPVFIQTDNTNDTLFVSSRIMESFQDSLARLIATDSVEIIRKDLAAEAGISIFYSERDSIILRKNPVVWYSPQKYENHQVSGDSVFIKLKQRRLETVFVFGSASAASQTDSNYSNRFNQLTGEEIILRFAEDKLQQIEVDRTATSFYYLFDEGKPNGANKTTGDHIAFSFFNGQLGKIKVIGGVEGEYFPEKMIRNRENKYNLQGFDWKTNKPTKINIGKSYY